MVSPARKVRLLAHLVACSLAHFPSCLNPMFLEVGPGIVSYVSVCWSWLSVVRQGTDGMVGRCQEIATSTPWPYHGPS